MATPRRKPGPRSRPVRPVRRVEPAQSIHVPFFKPQAINGLLRALVQRHKSGLQMRKYVGFSEDYRHPSIGEIAGIRGRKVIIGPLDPSQQRGPVWEKSPRSGMDDLAHDVAHLALSVNIPFTQNQRARQGKPRYLINHIDPVPSRPINVRSFASQYAKLMGIKDPRAFAKKVVQSYGALNYMHWDHAGDHV